MEEQNMSIVFQRATEHFLKLFVTPEIDRRQSLGQVEKPFNLQAAQIIFYPDGRKPLVRLNSEVKAIAKMKLKEGIDRKPGDPISTNEIEGIEGLQLTDDEDPDCGHATIFRIKDQWFLAFDFIYNKGIATKHIETARQFLALADYARKEKYWSAFVDNLFSAAELSAKALLLGHIPSPEFRDKANHKAIHRRLNQFSHLGNVKAIYAQTFNELTNLRYPARYLEKEYSGSEEEYQIMYSTVESMVEDVITSLHLNLK